MTLYKMRKPFICLVFAVLLILCMILPVAAAEENVVSASTNATMRQGDYGYCYVDIGSTEGLSALDVAVHFDPAKVRITNVYNSISCTLYDSVTQEDHLQVSYILDGKGAATKTRLFYFQYQVLSDAEVGDAWFDITIGEAYDAAIQDVAVSGSRCSFAITEAVTAKSCNIYSNSSVSTAVGQEFTLNYRFSTGQIASGTAVISYDPELFEVVGVTNGAFLSGKVSDINTDLAGEIYISFVGTAYGSDTDLLSVTFKTIKNEAQTSGISLRTPELLDLELNPITCNGCATNIQVAYDDTYLGDAPAMRLQGSFSHADMQMTLQILLDADSRLGAGDFTLAFDPDLVSLRSYSMGFAPDYFTIDQRKAAQGELIFHILSLSDIVTEETVLTVVFDVKHPYTGKAADFILTGDGLTDSMTEEIGLNFVNTSVALEYKVTFVNADGTVLHSSLYHYGDPVQAPDDPVIEGTACDSYTFTGWDKTISACTADVTYTATYSIIEDVNCTDGDIDHECDICQATMGTHEAAEGSHDCAYCGKPVTVCGDYYVTYGDGYIVITNSGIAALKPSTFIQNMSVSILMERIDSLAAWVGEKGYTNVLGKEYVDFCYNWGLDPNTMTAEQIANSYVLYAANNIGAMSKEEIYNLIFNEDGSGFDRAVLVYAMVTAYAYATDEALINELDQQYELPEFFSMLADIVASPGFISYFESRQGEKDLAAFSATMEMICRSFESTEAVDKILSEGFASDDFIILLEEVIENYSHDCGVCGAQLTECMDDDNNHKCDLCDETLSQCIDSDTNHACDICQTTMGEHADGDDNDHLCDYGCGKDADDGHHGGNATCTEQAICDECGERYGNRLDHTPGDAAVQNIFNGDTGVMPSYDSVTYCTVCGEEVERTTVTLPQNIFAGSTMALNDSLEFSFVTFTDMLPEGAYAMIVRSYADGTQDVVYKYTTVEGDWNPYRNNSMLAFTYGNLAAKHMADAFYAVVYNAEGEIIGVRADSMRDYAMRMLATNEKNKNTVGMRLFVDLLKYGAAAQLHFNYGTEDLADSRLTEQQLAYTELASAGQNEQNKGGFIGNAVSLESRIELNFVCSTTLVTRDMRAVFTYTDRSGNLVTVEVAGEDFVNYRNNTMWGLTIAMPLAECAQDVTCTVYDGDQIVITGTDSVEGYLARQYNSAPIMAATWTFIESARAYFTKVEVSVSTGYEISFVDKKGKEESEIDYTKGDVTIFVGGSIMVQLYDRETGAPVSGLVWYQSMPDKNYISLADKVNGVRVTGNEVTVGVPGVAYVRVMCDYEGTTYTCIVRVREKPELD